jgi:hypothetical protein
MPNFFLYLSKRLIVKILSLSAFLLSLPLGAQVHKSCEQFSHNKTQALKITKTFNPANELLISLELDMQSCRFKQVARPISLYWEMGKKSSGLSVPCENLLLKEVREIFGYNNHEEMYAQIVASNTGDKLIANMPALSDLPRQVGSKDELASQVTFIAKRVGDKCLIESYLEINKHKLKVDRLHSLIRYLKLQRVELYQNNQLIKSF